MGNGYWQSSHLSLKITTIIECQVLMSKDIRYNLPSRDVCKLVSYI